MLKKGKPPIVSNDSMTFEAPYLTPEYLRNADSATMCRVSQNSIIVENGDLILLWDGSNAGEVFYAKYGVLSSTMVKLIIVKPIDKTFLYYLLKNQEGGIKSATSGSGIPHVDKKLLGELEIPPFELHEQGNIARILSNVDDYIISINNLISKYQRLKTGLMQDLLTKGIDENGNIRSEKTHKFKDSPVGRIPIEWNIKRLDECSNVVISNVDKKYHASEIPVQLCNYMDVYSNEEISEKLSFMLASATRDEINKFSLKKGDVIITKDSGTPDDIAIPAYVNADIDDLVCGYHLALIRPKPSFLIGEFLNKLLQMSFYKKYFGALATGSTRFGLSQGAIKNAAIVLPSIKEQERIIEVLSLQSKQIKEQKLRLNKYTRLKNGLMQDLLTGKVRVSPEVLVE